MKILWKVITILQSQSNPRKSLILVIFAMFGQLYLFPQNFHAETDAIFGSAAKFYQGVGTWDVHENSVKARIKTIPM